MAVGGVPRGGKRFSMELFAWGQEELEFHRRHTEWFFASCRLCDQGFEVEPIYLVSEHVTLEKKAE